VATSLAAPGLDPELAARSAGYTAAAGALLGLLLLGVGRLVNRRRGRAGQRALRSDEEPVMRPEPGRTQALDLSLR
jgi:hypothetical protein